MSKLTLDEAIKHCLEVAEENDLAAGTYELLAENNHNAYEKLTAETNSLRCAKCATDHQQLAEWLTELLQRREWCAQYEVEQISNLEQHDMLLRDYEILNERYKEAKRLLKASVEDLNATVAEVYNGRVICKCCKWKSQIGECCCTDDGGCDTDYRWRYADEAEKLIEADRERGDDESR